MYLSFWTRPITGAGYLDGLINLGKKAACLKTLTQQHHAEGHGDPDAASRLASEFLIGQQLEMEHTAH